MNADERRYFIYLNADGWRLTVNKKLHREDINNKCNTKTQPAKKRAKSGIQEALRGELAAIACPVSTLGAVLSGLGLGSGS
jgi:hypothetical protein